MATIMYLGNFLETYCTEVHLANTLESMGHKVERVQENFINPDHFAERLKTESFDLFLFTRTWGQTLQRNHLDILRERKIPSVSYHLDLYVGLKRDGGMGSDPFWETDYVFTPDGDPKSAKVFKEKKINHYYLKPGVYEPEVYIHDNVEPQKKVIFVGSYSYHPEYPYRQELIDFLKNTYRDGAFEHWGSEGLGVIRGAELNYLYAQTKIVVGDSLILPKHTYYWSDRVYETIGRGGFLIHPYIKGLEEEFTDKEDIVYYKHGDLKDLENKINYYLIHDEEREAIRRAGNEKVKNNYTYNQRLQEALNVVFAEKP